MTCYKFKTFMSLMVIIALTMLLLGSYFIRMYFISRSKLLKVRQTQYVPLKKAIEEPNMLIFQGFLEISTEKLHFHNWYPALFWSSEKMKLHDMKTKLSGAMIIFELIREHGEPITKELVLENNKLQKNERISTGGYFYPIGIRFKEGLNRIKLKLIIPRDVKLEDLHASLFFHETSNIAEPTLRLCGGLFCFFMAFVLCLASYFYKRALSQNN